MLLICFHHGHHSQQLDLSSIWISSCSNFGSEAVSCGARPNCGNNRSADFFYRSNLLPHRPAKDAFGYSSHPMKSNKARIKFVRSIVCGRPLKYLPPLQCPAVQVSLDLSDESIESRGVMHPLLCLVRCMDNSTCDRAAAFGSSVSTGNRYFRRGSFDTRSFFHIFCH
jgi:hypothetical protein